MGKGLSPLQKNILAVLEDFPSYEEHCGDSLKLWARPGQILQALRREPTSANRVALSKALDRLYARGLVARAMSSMMNAGKSRFYVRITEPKNAGADHSPQVIIVLERRRELR